MKLAHFKFAMAQPSLRPMGRMCDILYITLATSMTALVACREEARRSEAKKDEATLLGDTFIIQPSTRKHHKI